MIYVITPCSRPENIPEIAKTIPSECRWVIVHDNKTPVVPIDNAMFLTCEDTGIVGTKAQNFALDNLQLNDQDFVLLHDDDNIIHPKWYDTVCKYLYYDFSILTWGQLHKNETIRLQPTSNPRIGNIDTACFMVKWKYNKNNRHEYRYDHDGVYANLCSKNGPVICVNDYISYYNYLR